MVRQFALSGWNLFTTRAELIDGTFVVAHDCDLSIGEAETRGPPTAQWELQADLGYTVRSMEWGGALQAVQEWIEVFNMTTREP